MARGIKRTAATAQGEAVTLTLTIEGDGRGFPRIMLDGECIGEVKTSAREKGTRIVALLSAAIPASMLPANITPIYNADKARWETDTHTFETVPFEKGKWTPRRAHEAPTPIRNVTARATVKATPPAALPADNVLAVLAQMSPAQRDALREALK